MEESGESSIPPPLPRPWLERLVEQILFGSRWLLAPIYLGLAASLLVLLVKFALTGYGLVVGLIEGDSSGTVVGILSLVDVSLIGNLILIVMFAGYENFVSKFDIDDHRDKPNWLGHIDFADLKIKLITTLVAISAIHLLEQALNLDYYSDRDLAWSLGIQAAFLIAGLFLALMDRLSNHHQ
jgi:uncharacterized protein (TIGR00645 family)